MKGDHRTPAPSGDAHGHGAHPAFASNDAVKLCYVHRRGTACFHEQKQKQCGSVAETPPAKRLREEPPSRSAGPEVNMKSTTLLHADQFKHPLTDLPEKNNNFFYPFFVFTSGATEESSATNPDGENLQHCKTGAATSSPYYPPTNIFTFLFNLLILF